VLNALQAKQPSLISDIQAFGDKLDLLVSDNKKAKEAVELAFVEEKIIDYNLSLQEPTLENVFVSLLQEEKALNENGEQQDQPSGESLDNSTPSQRKPKRTGVRSFPFEALAERSFLGDTTAGNAIEAISISKNFGDFKAVDKLTLKVGYGDIYGLLGANGAGKTTTIKMLCGLIPQSAGNMALCSHTSDLRSAVIRQRLGYMSQKFTLYDDLTIKENLDYYCGVYLVPQHLKEERIAWALASTELTGQSNLLAGSLPGGWKQRLAFSAAVLHHPEVLFLDEPTSGVDPLARREMWRLIRQFAATGTAILVTTHFLEEAEYCNTLGFMVAGKLVTQGSPSAIKAGQPGMLFELTVSDTKKAYELSQELLEPWRTSRFAGQLHVVLDDEKEHVKWLEKHMTEAQIKILQMRRLPYSLEDAFISIVQREAALK
jgi:ABC-2 type transport system ATP-binding protein